VSPLTREIAQASQPKASQASETMRREGVVPAKTLPLPPGSLTLPVILGERRGREHDRELLPRILSDEVAFRSELLSRVQRAEQALLEAIDQRLYAIDKASLPAIANSLAKLVQVSERLVDRTKDLAMPEKGTQVAGLYAKYALLQQALRDRGLVDAQGKLRNRSQGIAAIDVEASASEPGPGGIGTGSLSDGGAPDSPSLDPSPPPGASDGVSAQGPIQESQEAEGVITEPERLPDEKLPLGPPSALDGPRRYRRLDKIRSE